MDKLLLFPGRTEKDIFTYVIDAEKNYLEKTASEYHPTIASYINAAKPIPGKTQVLLTALGAGEWWGDNVNSDYFEESELAHEGPDYGYKTFELYAKVYRHHCFLPGTLVKTKIGMRPIETIEVDDEVFTHKGRWRRVKNTFARPYNGDLVTITVQGLGSDVCCTDNHKFLVVTREQMLCPKHNTKGKGRNFCTFFRSDEDRCYLCGRSKIDLSPEWVEAAQLRPHDYILRTCEDITTNSESDPKVHALGILSGFFLADGCYTKRNGDYRGLQFTFCEKRTDVHKKLENAASEMGLKISLPYFHKDNHTATFGLHSPELAQIFLRRYGEYCDKKFISREAIEALGTEGCKYLIGSYLDGDGSLPLGKTKNEGIARARSCNHELLQDIRDLCFSVGIPATYNFDSKNPKDNSLVKGIKPSAIVQLAAGHANKLSKYSLRCEKLSRIPSKKGNGELVYQGFVLHMVRSVARYQEACVVHNIEVEEDNSYQVYGLNTHNCNKDPNNNYGDVILSVYNPLYHRVELIVGVRHDNGMDIVQRVERGDYPDWSMGVKVKYDVCHICGNKAPTRVHYCEHARYMLGKIHPATGKKVYVLNKYPKFFDISCVLIGADRTAKTLRKVASPYYGNIPVLSSAYLAEKMAANKKATITKEVPASDPPASHDSLKTLARSIEQVKSMEEPMPKEVLNDLAKHPLQKSMSTMIMMGILPKPQEFQRIYLVRTGNSALADKMDEKNLCFDPSSVDQPEQKSYDEVGLDHSNFSGSLMDKLLPFMSGRSYAAPHLGTRLVIMIKKGQEYPQPRLVKISSDDERKPLGPLLPLLAAAGAYAALLRTAPKATLRGVDKILSTSAGVGLATALGLGLVKIFNTVTGPKAMGQYSSPQAITNPDTNDMFSRIEALKQKPLLKVGYHMGSAAKRLFLGVPAAYMASGVLQKQKELSPYDEESRTKKFFRLNPDVVSAALIADAVLSGKGHPFSTRSAIEHAKSLFKSTATSVKHKLASEAGPLDKIADAQDFLSSSLIWPLAMGKANLPGRIVEGLFDQAALEAGSKLVKKWKKDQETSSKHAVSGKL